MRTKTRPHAPVFSMVYDVTRRHRDDITGLVEAATADGLVAERVEIDAVRRVT